ncbi:MAG: NADH-quinone oxidoreductase subunit E [Desulfuromonadales bacterium GWD2_61_12]|nr:MAG: NADH-quinone oxidoreductase subunit E [Desulfuromonadales bacterium GWD2_61_12]HAD03934.1 NADH-quinone oxidoreductase subunit NuoE [Desulfuromonas sp.]HBT83399.1 NADH-quinone oxidoreductase subunit NuoE [Desulfuromonas sp.]
MTDLLQPDILAALQDRAAASAHPRELVVDVLRAIQDQHGWVPDEGVRLAAQILGILEIEVEEVATFYDKIYRRPVGKKVIHVCDSICCWLGGGEELLAALQAKLGIAPGETTADGVFTLLPTCCLGACGDTPALMIGLTTYGRVTAERLDEILAKERNSITAIGSPPL